MYGLLLDHVQQFVIFLYNDMASVSISEEFFKSIKHVEMQSLLMFAYLV